VQVPAFRAAGLEVVALAGHRLEKTRETAGRLNIARFFEDWRELVEDNQVDLVSIVTPPSEHADIAVAALQNGKHVLSEKPTALNAAEAERMLSVARQHATQLALIDHELRFLPAWREAQRRFHEIGALRNAEIRYSSASRGDPSRPWNWWSDKSRGGGVLGAVGSHAVDSMRYFAGEIEAARGYLHTFIQERSSEDGPMRVSSDDFCHLDLRMVNGAFASLHMDVVSTRDEPTSWIFHGEQGGIRLIDDRFEMAPRGGSWQEQDCEKSDAMEGDSSGGRFGTGTIHMARAIKSALDDGDRSALKLAATFEDGLQQQRTLDAARESHRQGGGWVLVEQT